MKKNYNIRFIVSFFVMLSIYCYAENFTYQLPISDFNTQHKVGGTFVEYRGEGTRDHIHRGIDISIENVAVYSVLDGTFYTSDNNTVILEYDYGIHTLRRCSSSSAFAMFSLSRL